MSNDNPFNPTGRYKDPIQEYLEQIDTLADESEAEEDRLEESYNASERAKSDRATLIAKISPKIREQYFPSSHLPIDNGKVETIVSYMVDKKNVNTVDLAGTVLRNLIIQSHKKSPLQRVRDLDKVYLLVKMGNAT